MTDFGSFSDISRKVTIPTGIDRRRFVGMKLQREFLLPEHVSRGGEFPPENGPISDNDMFGALSGKLWGNCADEDEDGVGGGRERVTHAEDNLLVRRPRGYGAVAGEGRVGARDGGRRVGDDWLVGGLVDGFIDGLMK